MVVAARNDDMLVHRVRRRKLRKFGRAVGIVLVAVPLAAVTLTAVTDQEGEDESAVRLSWRDPNERRQSTAQLIQANE